MTCTRTSTGHQCFQGDERERARVERGKIRCNRSTKIEPRSVCQDENVPFSSSPGIVSNTLNKHRLIPVRNRHNMFTNAAATGATNVASALSTSTASSSPSTSASRPARSSPYHSGGGSNSYYNGSSSGGGIGSTSNNLQQSYHSAGQDYSMYGAMDPTMAWHAAAYSANLYRGYEVAAAAEGGWPPPPPPHGLPPAAPHHQAHHHPHHHPHAHSFMSVGAASNGGVDPLDPAPDHVGHVCGVCGRRCCPGGRDRQHSHRNDGAAGRRQPHRVQSEHVRHSRG